MMNRRNFLAMLAAAVAADPDKALWVPGRKKIIIPGPREYTYDDLRLAEMYAQMQVQKQPFYQPYIPMSLGLGETSWSVLPDSYPFRYRHQNRPIMVDGRPILTQTSGYGSGTFEQASVAVLRPLYRPYVRAAQQWMIRHEAVKKKFGLGLGSEIPHLAKAMA